MVLLFVLFSFVAVNSQNFPNYWNGKIATNLNGTMEKATPIKIISSNIEYNRHKSATDKIRAKLTRENDKVLPADQFNPSNEPPANKSGKIRKLELSNGYMTYLEVMDEFDFNGNKTVPVKISVSWLDKEENLSKYRIPGEFATAVKNAYLLNITLTLGWKRFSNVISEALNKEKVWELEDYLCFYDGTEAKIVNGKCVIPYKLIIDNYYSMWVPYTGLITESVNGERKRATNNKDLLETPPCYDDGEDGNDFTDDDPEQDCDVYEEVVHVEERDFILNPEVNWYLFDSKPAATGWSINTTFGYNRTKFSFDLNFTVMFNNWTVDFPEGLLYNYRDGSFLYEIFRLEIYYWTEDPDTRSERPVPSEFFFMTIVMMIIGASLLLAILVRVLTGSGHAFSLHFWAYWKKLQAHNLLDSAMDDKSRKEVSVRERFRETLGEKSGEGIIIFRRI